METKRCSICEEEKALDSFYRRKKRKNQWQSYCKKCHLKKGNEARKRNPNTRKRTKENWQAWSSKEENKLKRREYQRRYYKQRSQREPFYRLKMRMGSWILSEIKKQKGTKQGSVWNYLPYTPEQLKKHIEEQFEDWMTWENHGNGEGKWNLDHIIPQSHLPYDSLEHPNFQKCWALENLQPLSWRENLKKSNKID